MCNEAPDSKYKKIFYCEGDKMLAVLFQLQAPVVEIGKNLSRGGVLEHGSPQQPRPPKALPRPCPHLSAHTSKLEPLLF